MIRNLNHRESPDCIIPRWVWLVATICAGVMLPRFISAQNATPPSVAVGELSSRETPLTLGSARAPAAGIIKDATDDVEPESAAQLTALSRPEFTIPDVALKIIEEREIPSLASGLLQTSHVQEGTLVQVGGLVAEIDSEMTALDLDKLQKELEIARNEAATRVELEYVLRSIEVAQSDLLRATQTNQRLPGAIARTEIDQLNLLVQKSIAEKDKTEFQITQKKLLSEVRAVEVAMGKRKLMDHTIKAPISGMVVEVFKRQGEWVEASESIARVVQLDRLKAEVKIPATAALNGMLGRAAEFSPALPSLAGKSYSAKVIFVHPEANPVNASVRVWVEIENSNLELVPGLMGSLKVFAATTSVPPQNRVDVMRNRPSENLTPTVAKPAAGDELPAGKVTISDAK